MGGAGANGFSLLHNDSKNNFDEHPITFYAPELPAETLLDVSCFITFCNDLFIKVYISSSFSVNTTKLLQSSILF